ncbi:MAG: DUF3857 domain-containing protein [Blastocatellia bacterium]
MTKPYVLRALLAAIFFLGLSAPLAMAGDDWKPVDPAHLAMKSPVVEPDADAEALLWDVRVDDQDTDLVFTHYIRIKIFTERGKESQGQIDLTYFGNNRVRDIAGRTIKPDGTIIELKKDAVFERTIVKVSGIKVKAKSFAMPGVEPGAIIEYRWREIFAFDDANNVRLQFQRDIPVQLVRYHIKPFPFISAGMAAQTFNAGDPMFTKERDGFYLTEMTNMPAFREEPNMPPEDQVRAWTLLYYSKDVKKKPAEYWRERGKSESDVVKPLIKANDDVKKTAAQIIGDAATPEQKIERLYTYCQTKIKNINDDASGMTAEDRKNAKKNNSPADTLKHGAGTAGDIDLLFAALAAGAGFDARLARIGDRSRMFADFTFPNTYFVQAFIIAVKVGNDWRFFEPSSAYCPLGMLPWQREGQQALILDSKEPTFVRTQLSSPDKSVEKRTATLTLDADGTLEGDATIEYTGHLAMIKKEENDDDSQEQREASLRELIKAHLSTAEVTNIKIENVTDPAKPFIYRFHVRVPGYAERTGKRLFLQPAFFEKGEPTLFSASARRHQVYFHYTWQEEDNVTISLPPGYALDSPDAPAPFKINDVAAYGVKMQVLGKNEKLIYHRNWMFNALIFPQTSYAGIKQVFDMVHKGDSHTLSFKQASAQ